MIEIFQGRSRISGPSDPTFGGFLKIKSARLARFLASDGLVSILFYIVALWAQGALPLGSPPGGMIPSGLLICCRAFYFGFVLRSSSASGGQGCAPWTAPKGFALWTPSCCRLFYFGVFSALIFHFRCMARQTMPTPTRLNTVHEANTALQPSQSCSMPANVPENALPT